MAGIFCKCRVACRWANPPRPIFTSPSSQYPTGTVLSLDRRLELLEGAERSGSWIIEDDYDNELRYHSHPIASLFGLSAKQRVLYLGTFSKLMFPGLRLAYLVIPEDLVDAFYLATPNCSATAAWPNRRRWPNSSPKATSPPTSNARGSSTRNAATRYTANSNRASAAWSA